MPPVLFVLEHLARSDYTGAPTSAGYQRSCPVIQGKCKHQKHHSAPVHVCIGHAGADFYGEKGTAGDPLPAHFANLAEGLLPRPSVQTTALQ